MSNDPETNVKFLGFFGAFILGLVFVLGSVGGVF